MNGWRTRTNLSILALASASGCSTLLGIEELHEAPADAAGSTSTSDGAVDRSPAGGAGGNNGGNGGNAGNRGGASGAGGSSGSGGRDAASTDSAVDVGPGSDVSTGGRPNDGGGAADRTPDISNPDDGGTIDAGVVDAGMDRITAITVHGRVIDQWRHVVPGVPVTIAGTNTNTNANGEFTVSGVVAPYDVAITVRPVVNNVMTTYGWLFKGLTRETPTLQVARALAEHSASIVVRVTSVDFASLPGNESIVTAFGGPDGMFGVSPSNANTMTSSGWIGPATTSMSGHGLRWTRAGTGFNDLPTAYRSYDTHPIALQASTESNITFDLPDQTITSGVLRGTVTGSPSGGQRSNEVWVRFTSDAVIPIVTDSSQVADFSYLVPSLAGGSITLAAQQGYPNTPPYAVVHKSNLVAGQTGVTLEVPDPPAQIAPAGGATGVGPSTVFRWSGSAKVFVWAVEFVNERKELYVVTSERQTQIPDMPNGPVLAGNAPYVWWVETNGAYQSVDEATGPDGMLDPYRLSGDLWGPARSEGSFTSTPHLSFTTAP